jgi:hypothetical protein
LAGLDLYLVVYRRDPAVLEDHGRGEDELGFGLGAELLTGTVVLTAHFVLTALSNGIADAVAEWSKQTSTGLVGKLARRIRASRKTHTVPSPVEPAALTPEMIAALHESALAVCRNMNIPHDKAQLAADAVIGWLVRTITEQRL